MNFTGITTALVTPFLRSELDQESFLRILASQVKAGIRNFVLNGTTGESPTLKEAEVESLCLWFNEYRKKEKRELNLILGTGTNSTSSSVEKTKKAKTLGADAVLVVVPYYNKPNQEGLLDHFRTVAQSTPLPVFLYNVPSRTSSSLELNTIADLSKISNIVGIKEASGNMDFLKEIKKSCGKDFLFLSGDDFTAVESFLLGGDGVVSVVSHILGKEFIRFFEKSLKKDQSVLEDFKKYEFFLKELYTLTNPIGIKQILKETGEIASSETRLPLKTPDISRSFKESFENLKKESLI